MGSNCTPCCRIFVIENFMLSLPDNNQADVIEVFNSTSRYLADLLNIHKPYFEQIVVQINSIEHRFNEENSFDTETPFLGLDLSIRNGKVASKNYDKRDDFNFDIVNFSFLS